MMTKYELTYKVCATSACTSYIDTPSGLKVRYEEISSPVNGNIASTETRIIGLATENNLSTTYYIQLFIRAGYDTNPLPLTNQIFESTSDLDVKVISVIAGLTTNTFSTTSKYDVTKSCVAGSSLSVSWNGSGDDGGSTDASGNGGGGAVGYAGESGKSGVLIIKNAR